MAITYDVEYIIVMCGNNILYERNIKLLDGVVFRQERVDEVEVVELTTLKIFCIFM
jgi:hypothetical protein